MNEKPASVDTNKTISKRFKFKPRSPMIDIIFSKRKKKGITEHARLCNNRTTNYVCSIT